MIDESVRLCAKRKLNMLNYHFYELYDLICQQSAEIFVIELFLVSLQLCYCLRIRAIHKHTLDWQHKSLDAHTYSLFLRPFVDNMHSIRRISCEILPHSRPVGAQLRSSCWHTFVICLYFTSMWNVMDGGDVRLLTFTLPFGSFELARRTPK